MRRRRLLGGWVALVVGGLALGGVALGYGHPALGSTDSRPVPPGPGSRCSADLEVLAPRLLADLPGYANRVAARSQGLPQETLPRTTVLATSTADLTPIDLTDLGSGRSLSPDGLEQVFFTTLERQFWPDRIVALQHHHWLFLAPTADGWHLALLYSSLGTPGEPGDRAPTPPQEASDGIVGQAVRLWLRDCRAGAVASPPTPSP